jgi:hypothetical protein
MAEISRPDIVGAGHESMEILLEAPVVEGLESSGIIEILALGICGIGVLAEDAELQGIRPPVSVSVYNQPLMHPR